MEERTHSDIGKKVSAVVDNAISELIELGVESRDRACTMMACLATIRIEDNEERKSVRQYADELIWDYDDTDEGGGEGKG